MVVPRHAPLLVEPLKQRSKISEWTNRIFKEPILYWATAARLLHDNTLVSIQLWLESKKTKPHTGRVEIRHLMRNKKDFVTFGLSTAYLALPLMDYTYPRMIRLYPNFLASVFVPKETWLWRVDIVEEKRKEMASLLIEKMNARILQLPDNGPLKRHLDIWKQTYRLYQTQPQKLTYFHILQLFPLFRDYGVGLLNVPYSETKEWMSYLGLFTPLWAKPRLYRWAEWIMIDNELIRNGNASSLSDLEILEAAEERGMIHVSSLSLTELRNHLVQHGTFTQRLIETAKRHAKSKSTNYQMDEADIAAATGLMVLSRVLNVNVNA